MIKLLLPLLFLLPMTVHANTTKCALRKAPGIYLKVKRLKGTDKLKHCVFSCDLALQCDAFTSFKVGVFKELIDWLGKGNAELKDLKANAHGILLSYSGRARDYKECKRECSKYYDFKYLER